MDRHQQCHTHTVPHNCLALHCLSETVSVSFQHHSSFRLAARGSCGILPVSDTQPHLPSTLAHPASGRLVVLALKNEAGSSTTNQEQVWKENTVPSTFCR